MKGTNTYNLCERKLPSAPICSLQRKEVKPEGQEQLATQEMKDNHSYLMIKSI
jgi:hypothetical protein